MLRSATLTFFCVGLLCFLGSNAVAGDDCAKTITTKCEACHQVNVICDGLGKNSKGDWEKSISTMVAYGAELSQAEETVLVNCLSSHSADVAALCK